MNEYLMKACFLFEWRNGPIYIVLYKKYTYIINTWEYTKHVFIFTQMDKNMHIRFVLFDDICDKTVRSVISFFWFWSI